MQPTIDASEAVVDFLTAASFGFPTRECTFNAEVGRTVALMGLGLARGRVFTVVDLCYGCITMGAT